LARRLAPVAGAPHEVLRMAGRAVERAAARLLLQCGLWAATGRLIEVSGEGRQRPADEEVRTALLARAVREKMVPMVHEYSRHHDLGLGDDPARISTVARLVTEALYEHCRPVLAAVAAAEIKVVLLKGADLDLHVYPQQLPRLMGDVDLLVRPSDAARVAAIFERAGFVQGDLNKPLMRIEPLSAEDKSDLEADRPELYEFAKLVLVPDLAGFADVIDRYLQDRRFIVLGGDVYLALGYDVHVNLAPDFDLRDVWSDLREIAFPGVGTTLLGQSFADMLWYLASRMYHEILLLDEPGMRYFVDTVALTHHFLQSISWERVVAMCNRYKLHPSLFSTFWHINELLGPVIPAAVIDSCRPGTVEGDRGHDWGDFTPKMLGEVAIHPLLAPGASW
jgi:hypothetical protein